MNKLLKVLILLLIYSGLHAQPWKFKISLEKAKYLKGEPIFLLVELENISNLNYEVTYLTAGGSLKIILQDEQGNIIPEPGESHNQQFVQNVDMTFKPNEAMVFLRPISREFGNDFFKRDMDPQLKEGKYTVRLRFEDLLIRSKVDTLRKKYYYTQELSFEVVTQNSASRIMLDKFINIYENRFQTGKKEYIKDSIELINKDITNPYVTMIAYYLESSNAQVYQGKKIMNLIMKYPNRYWAVNLAVPLDIRKKNKIYLHKHIKNTLLGRTIKSTQLFLREYKKYEGIYYMTKEQFRRAKASKKKR